MSYHPPKYFSDILKNYTENTQHKLLENIGESI